MPICGRLGWWRRKRGTFFLLPRISTAFLLLLICCIPMLVVDAFTCSPQWIRSPWISNSARQPSHLAVDTNRIRSRANERSTPRNPIRFEFNRPTPSTTVAFRHHGATRTTTALGNAGSSLVTADDSWGNLATLSAVGVAAQHLGNNTAVGRLLGAPVTAMAITFGLASVGVLSPGGTQSSRSLQGLSIQFATPWILLGADFGGGSRNRDDDGDSASSSSSASTIPLLFGFGLASLATLAGGWVGWRATGTSLMASSLGQHNGLAIAAALLAKNIGGGINYVAVCAALRASPEAIATGLCIDNIGALVYFPISNLLASRYPDPCENDSTEDAGPKILANNEKNISDTPDVSSALIAGVTAESISVAFFSASTLLWMGDILATRVLKSPSAQIPIVTLMAVVLAGIVAPAASSRFSSWLPTGLKKTCDTLGTVCLYLFFTTAGAPGIRVARSMKSALWPLSVFSVLLYAIHGAILASCYQFCSGESWLRKRWKQSHRGNVTTKECDDADEVADIDSRVASASAAAASGGKSWKWSEIVSPQRLLVASSSAIGGPPTSVALARTVEWDSLVVPALLVGNIGYAISTFIGIAFYYFFKP